MDFLGEGLRRAVALLLAGDGEVYGIAVLTLKIGLIATVLACGLGIPVGFVLATRPFWGRRAALTVVNTALAFPTVVVGLLLYGLLSRRGPLGGLEWLYTWQAIVVGDVVLALPIAAALSGVAVVGPNGSGKSTLLQLSALLERPSEGEVRLDGVAVAEAGPRRRITLVEQRPVLLRGTVRENLEFGLQVRGIRRTEVNSRVDSDAGRLGITPLLHRRRHELSDGEVQRVAVARALAVEPDVLLLDEPASSADRAAAQTLYRALAEERARRPLAVCLASHQLEDAYRWADDVRALAE